MNNLIVNGMIGFRCSFNLLQVNASDNAVENVYKMFDHMYPEDFDCTRCDNKPIMLDGVIVGAIFYDDEDRDISSNIWLLINVQDEYVKQSCIVAVRMNDVITHDKVKLE